jgi:putative two-component system response regulator
MDKSHVLIVDDEPVICDLLSENLSELGYSCEIAQDGNYALHKMATEEFDIVLLDIRLPGISGVDLLKEIKPRYNSAVIMITAVDDVNTAVESMKLGAMDYLVKPFDLDKLSLSIITVLKKTAMQVGNKDVQNNSEVKELQEIDAIASGIEVKLDLTDKRSTTVTQRTIEIAREIGIPDERIIQWVEKRAKTNRNNLKLLKKFSQNTIAQAEMGMAPEYRLDDDLYKSGN